MRQKEGPVTGSYNRKRADGSSPSGSEPLPNAELEPLGGKIPDADPYDPDIPPPAGLRDFRYNAGDVFRPEYGCIVDGFVQDGPGACTQMLMHGSGTPDERFEIPHGLGYWTEEPGPTRTGPPYAPGEEPMIFLTTIDVFHLIGGLISPLNLFQAQSTKTQGKPSRFNEAKLKTAISFCSQEMFGVELVNGGAWTKAGKTGTLNFQVMNGGTVPVIEDGVQTGSVNAFAVNNVTTRSYNELGALGLYIAHNGPYGPQTNGIMSKSTRKFGMSDFTMESNTNFTASDVMNPRFNMASDEAGLGSGLGISRFIEVQIHETGNSLAEITGKSIDEVSGIRSGDPDEGWKFEVCVFKNYRNLLGGRKMKLAY